jgi:phosphohistidine phosphatase
MRILLIRHAPALSRVNWLRDDMERPLSDKGITAAKKVFKELAKIYDTPEMIFCSEALRARETAQLFAKNFRGARVSQSEFLNPGAGFEGFKAMLEGKNYESAAFIGHEPDLSNILRQLISADENVSIEFKKTAVAEIEVDEDFKGMLKALIPAKIFS